MKLNSKSDRVLSDSELVDIANGLVGEEKHLDAARILRKVKNSSKLSERHRNLLSKAGIIERAVNELLSSPHEEWTKQGESHDLYDFTIFYKVGDGASLTCRIESPIPASLLIPLLSVLNESSLYRTWIPSWQTPFKLGVQESNELLRDGRGHQVIQVSVSVPWPMKTREALFLVQAVDEIDSNGFIIAKMTSIGDTEEGEIVRNGLPDDFEVPEVTTEMERCDFGGIALFRQCPEDHPNYQATRCRFPEGDLILIQFMMNFDAKLNMVPKRMINFITRTALGVVWTMLLRVAEEVRDGHREEHCKIIEQKSGFYKWVEDRCKYMLDKIGNNPRTTKNRKCSAQRQQTKNETSEMEAKDVWTLQEILRMNM